MIEIENLVKDYGAKRAVNGLNLSVDAGVFFTFLGPNGDHRSVGFRTDCDAGEAGCNGNRRATG